MARERKQAWYEINAKAGTGRDEVYIFGPVVDYKWWDDDEDVTAKEFIDTLKNLGDIDLHINSPGGSVPAGNAIYNALKRHPGSVDVYVDGMALSIASVIAMAGDRVIMPANTMLMIHDPASAAWGTAAEMRKAAEMLDKFKVGLVAAYHEKSGKPHTEIEQLMEDETWMTAAEAVELGFADEIEDAVDIAAEFSKFDLSGYRNVPKALINKPLRVRAEAKRKEKPMDIKALKEKHPDIVAQIENEARTGLVLKADHDSAVTAARDEATAKATEAATASATAAERARVKALHAVCTANKMNALFMGMVEDGADEKAAGQRIQDVLAARDEDTDTASRHSGKAPENKAQIDHAGIYARVREAENVKA